MMIWRLEVMSKRGFEGTVLGTLVMPYCSGMGNLIFAFIIGRRGGDGGDVMINSLVNNVTNMTLVLGLPAIFWGIRILPSQKNKNKGAGKVQALNRLSVLLTLSAVLFFSGTVWALGRNGQIAFNEGMVLVWLFLFWQFTHVIEVLKGNVRQGRSLGWTLPFDLALLAIGAYGIYVSTDWLVGWISQIHTGFISAKHLGGQRLDHGAAQRHPRVLLRLARTAGNRLCLANWRCTCFHPTLHRHLRHVPHAGHTAVLSNGNDHSLRRDLRAPVLRRRCGAVAARGGLVAGGGLRRVPVPGPAEK